MRNCVVNVEDIQLLRLGNFGHAGGEGETIGRKLEERIRRYFDFVIVNALVAGGETDGVGVGNEVNLVTARGEFHTEFRGDDAASAVGGITGDSDSQGL